MEILISQKEKLEIKKKRKETVKEKRNAFDECVGRLDTVKKRISEFKDICIKTTKPQK